VGLRIWLSIVPQSEVVECQVVIAIKWINDIEQQYYDCDCGEHIEPLHSGRCCKDGKYSNDNNEDTIFVRRGEEQESSQQYDEDGNSDNNFFNE